MELLLFFFFFGEGEIFITRSYDNNLKVAWALAGSHSPFFLPYTVTHMCHDMTGLAIMAGRLDAAQQIVGHTIASC